MRPTLLLPLLLLTACTDEGEGQVQSSGFGLVIPWWAVLLVLAAVAAAVLLRRNRRRR